MHVERSERGPRENRKTSKTIYAFTCFNDRVTEKNIYRQIENRSSFCTLESKGKVGTEPILNGTNKTGTGQVLFACRNCSQPSLILKLLISFDPPWIFIK